MLGVNTFTIVGKTVDTPDVQVSKSGKQFAVFHIEVPEIRNSVEVAAEFEIMCWGMAKDEATALVKPGRIAAITGSLQAQSNISRTNGNKYYSARLMANRITVDDLVVATPAGDDSYNPWAEIDDQRLPF